MIVFGRFDAPSNEAEIDLTSSIRSSFSSPYCDITRALGWQSFTRSTLETKAGEKRMKNVISIGRTWYQQEKKKIKTTETPQKVATVPWLPLFLLPLSPTPFFLSTISISAILPILISLMYTSHPILSLPSYHIPTTVSIHHHLLYSASLFLSLGSLSLIFSSLSRLIYHCPFSSIFPSCSISSLPYIATCEHSLFGNLFILPHLPTSFFILLSSYVTLSHHYSPYSWVS